MTLNVRINGSLTDFVTGNISDDGDYDNVSEYIRDLVRQDKARKEALLFSHLKAELSLVFNSPSSEYSTLSAADVIARNKQMS